MTTDPLDGFPEAVVTVDADNRVLGWNPACARLFGVDAAEALDRDLALLLTLAERDDTGQFPERRWASCDGRRVPVEVTRWHSDGPQGPVEHLLLRDCTDRVARETEGDRAAEVLRRQARYDALTGLANRYELEERLEASLATAGDRVALLVADLDGFKPINDSYGHAVGDEVLAAVARRLRGCVREGDVVARLGGDEFVVLTRVVSAVEPSALARRVREALSDPIRTSEGVLTIGASVGVALAEQGGDAADLLRRADKAMYRVKLAGS